MEGALGGSNREGKGLAYGAGPLVPSASAAPDFEEELWVAVVALRQKGKKPKPSWLQLGVHHSSGICLSGLHSFVGF